MVRWAPRLKRAVAESDPVSMQSTLTLRKIKPSDLPAPPRSALEMLRACASVEGDVRQLASFADIDPIFTAEVMRVVNTPLFGITHPITSLQHADSLLRVHALRNIVLCLLVREAAQQLVIPGFDITLFWEDTLHRGLGARWIGARLGLDQDECFTAGLLQDLGLLILFYLHPAVANMFAELRLQDPVQRYQNEKALFGTTHDEVMMLLVSQWSLPQGLANAIGHHHQQCGHNEKMDQVLIASDWVNAVFCVSEINAVLDKVRSMLVIEFDLSQAEIDQQYSDLPQAIKATASALGLHIQTQTDFDHLLRQANTRLTKENIDYQELTRRLEKAITERDHLAAELNQEIAIAQEIQRHLMPDSNIDSLPVYGLNLPARNNSGKFFDYQKVPDGNICFAIGDVSGKGINAGLLMAKTASLFHCLAKLSHDPAYLLGIINNEICETLVRGFFVTMIAGIYNPQPRSPSGECRPPAGTGAWPGSERVYAGSR